LIISCKSVLSIGFAGIDYPDAKANQTFNSPYFLQKKGAERRIALSINNFHGFLHLFSTYEAFLLFIPSKSEIAPAENIAKNPIQSNSRKTNFPMNRSAM